MSGVEARARQSLGRSDHAVYGMVARAVEARHSGGGTLADVGCGAGALWPYLRGRFDRYVGVDVVRYEGFPADGEFHALDLDRGGSSLPDGTADVAAGVETIEHLENPRAFVRDLARLVRPGGWVIVTTPNQHSLLSKATFLLRGEHNAFRAGSYPAHITALLHVDLRRIAAECGLTDVTLEFSGSGRVPGTGRHWPAALGRLLPGAFSDNVLLAGRKPHDPSP
ncbi:MAG TPA: class I SAM-dependent methyltransferase [Longimicrobium sp.]|jgi:SAM-dependent methyltransferase|uniref:class I SAM-dependent methyltransferase n=1 Tax=Longimicrobium sp. TaxID=2029185 RepID=UPI002ED8AF18